MSERQIVVCDLGGENFGIDISRVFEIIRLQPRTAVPQAPAYVDGVINLRGRIVPVVDLATRFGIPRSKPSNASRIVVAGSDSRRVGLIVDGVSEVLMVGEDRIEDAPAAILDRSAHSFIAGIAQVADQLVMLLELDVLFGEAESAARAVAAPAGAADRSSPQPQP